MSDSTDGDHRKASSYTTQPCPWPDGMEVEFGAPREDGTYTVITIRSGSPLGIHAWQQNGEVLCSVIRQDGQEGWFITKPAEIRDAIKAMKERR